MPRAVRDRKKGTDESLNRNMDVFFWGGGASRGVCACSTPETTLFGLSWLRAPAVDIPHLEHFFEPAWTQSTSNKQPPFRLDLVNPPWIKCPRAPLNSEIFNTTYRYQNNAVLIFLTGVPGDLEDLPKAASFWRMNNDKSVTA